MCAKDTSVLQFVGFSLYVPENPLKYVQLLSKDVRTEA